MVGQTEHPILSYHPWKAVFKLAYVGFVIARLPLWLTNSLFPFLRPSPIWTFKQTLMSRIMYAVLDMTSRVGVTETPKVTKGTRDDGFQMMEPFPSEFYRGELAVEHTRPTTVAATWYPHSLNRDIGSKTVVLYLHGGAFVLGDSSEQFCGFIAKTFLEHGNADILLSVQYRLSGYSLLNPFPAAVQDALTSYLFLINTLHVPAHQIVLAGDSAGGNLAIALLRYIQEYGTELNVPSPKCCVLYSPWAAPFDFDIAKNPNFHADWLPPSFLRWGAHAYGASLHDPATHRYITPLGNPFTTSTPIFVNYGSLEIFDKNITRWAQEMKEKGNSVEIHRETGAPHDTLLLGDFLGFQESATKVALKVRAFISKT
ncbi:hypothetical protein RRF57_008078 [Xylaria bambusicola]|uniref:Alpha/beta hydrolase fold-3 domain-containing protein n=1 Tax=Xylaria bambusicola TaxID=326684 RepID=A0AAN7URG9_9PEZI